MLLLLTLACGGDETTDSTVFATSGACEINPADGAEVEFEALAATDHNYFTDAIAFMPSTVVGNETDWLDLQAQLGVTLPPIDFTSRTILATWFVGDTCDAILDSYQVVDIDGHVHLHATFDDGSDCGSCVGPGGGLVIVSVPKRDATPSICRAVRDTCR